ALNKLKAQGFYKRTTDCTAKYLNNLIEQGHRHVKRRFAKSAGCQNLRHASHTLKGIETVHALYKRKRSLPQPNFVLSTC
ncbi:DDE-type integrase/transposase/recombinase, partial [Bacillus thuringiensis]|uniref:DDE-type integrase/transposase/recombinase n=1 Tax=Bacillus thuringiensis TaxID=1428 RepID=UPI003F6AF146